MYNRMQKLERIFQMACFIVDHRSRVCVAIIGIILAITACSVPSMASEPEWNMILVPPAAGYFWTIITRVGASSTAVDGYDGQPVYYPPAESTGCAVLLYRENGANWSGPTGFYPIDLTSPLSDGSSYTWNNIYMWAQNYTVPGGVGQLMISPDYPVAPSYYNFQLVLDYVPEYMNWTGPRVFEFRRGGGLFNVPIPTVTNPLDGVRMHLTVYAGPIPEPSSLLTLAGAALTTAGFAWRKRRR